MLDHLLELYTSLPAVAETYCAHLGSGMGLRVHPCCRPELSEGVSAHPIQAEFLLPDLPFDRPGVLVSFLNSVSICLSSSNPLQMTDTGIEQEQSHWS